MEQLGILKENSGEGFFAFQGTQSIRENYRTILWPTPMRSYHKASNSYEFIVKGNFEFSSDIKQSQ
jgi:hypothetical protein